MKWFKKVFKYPVVRWWWLGKDYSTADVCWFVVLGALLTSSLHWLWCVIPFVGVFVINNVIEFKLGEQAWDEVKEEEGDY